MGLILDQFYAKLRYWYRKYLTIKRDYLVIMSKPNYYTVNLPRQVREAIEDLYAESEKVKKMFSNNKVKFIEDAIRRNLVFYENLYMKKEN